MNVDSISALPQLRTAQRNDTGQTSQISTGLNRDSFMELLLMQLKSQDPMNPMDSNQMFNQMSQLSMLEQLWDIRDLMEQSNTSQQLAQGSMLIGRHVEANSPSAGQISGLVEQVRMISGDVLLQIGSEEVRMDEVVSVQ